jgi:nitrogen regulatory protein PII 2
MKEVIALIRINKINQTKKALLDVGIPAFNVQQVLGRGEKEVDYRLVQGAIEGHQEAIAQLSGKPKLAPKRMVSIVVTDERLPLVIKTLIAANQTGSPGDGKIFVLPMSEAHRVRTGETDEAALDENSVRTPAPAGGRPPQRAHAHLDAS